MNQFISPNWHVVFIHYPIAFLSGGILIELLTVPWPRSPLRAAGRWMILLGALMAIPALTLGLYAFATVVGSGHSWYEIAQNSHWSRDQWQYMSCHIWLNSIGALLATGAVMTWLASSDDWRGRLYWPALVILIAAMASFAAGAWFGGESVYRYGTAVATAASSTASAEPHHQHGINWYIPPLELHVLLAGTTVAVALGAMALTIRRLERKELVPAPEEMIAAGESTDQARPEPAASNGPVMPNAPVVPVAPDEPRPIFAGRFWLAAAVISLCTAVAGLWSVVGVFSADALKHNGQMLRRYDWNNLRLPLHLIFGITILVLALLLAALARFARRRRKLTVAFLSLLVLAIAAQFWLGLAMLYDGRTGPALGFKSPPSAR